MEWWQSILVSGATVLLTLIINHIFSYIINHSSKKKEKQEEVKKELLEKIEEVKQDVTTQIADLEKDRNQIIQSFKDDIQALEAHIEELVESNNQQNKAIQHLLRNELKLVYTKWLELGYAPRDAKTDAESMYNSYHKLGANGVMDAQRERFMKLPEAQSVAPKRRSSKKEEEEGE